MGKYGDIYIKFINISGEKCLPGPRLEARITYFHARIPQLPNQVIHLNQITISLVICLNPAVMVAITAIYV